MSMTRSRTVFVYSLILGLVLSGLPCTGAFPQEFGGFRPGIKWQQINTPEIRVIFPKGLEAQAARVAGNISYINRNCLSSIGSAYKKLDLILNNEGVISNGYVTLSPYRSEFYTTPMQDGFSLGTGSWLDLLSLHEYRHALQYINLRQGNLKIAWWLFGDAGWGALINLTTPTWFFEGDAVATETALSDQGRGRMPSFLQQYKSILLTGGKYNFMKARNGSYRDLVPNEYELGYLMCSYGRENYGNNLWSDVLKKTASLQGIIYPFSDAVMRLTGLSTRQLYNKAFAEYQDTWTGESADTEITPKSAVSAPSRTVTEYRFPVFLENGDLLVYKESYREPGSIRKILPDGQEIKICNTGISTDPYFSAAGNRIAWSEVSWDERYSSRNYSDVVIFQPDSGIKRYLTRKQRYFSPAISPDGSRIVVAEVDSAAGSRLKILDSETGNVISSLPNTGNLFFTYPKWDTDGQGIISSARTKTGSMLIVKQLLSDGSLIRLSGEYQHVIGEVLVTSETILFTSGFSGINNVFSLSRTDRGITQLTGSKFGAYHAAISPDKKRLVYSDFDPSGYRLVSAAMDSLLWKKVIPVDQDRMHLFDQSYFEIEGGNILDKIPDQEFETSPYGQLRNGLRIHSWNLAPSIYSAGLNLTSDNVLNNLHFQGGFNYYFIEQAPGYHAEIKWGGLYPIFSAGISKYYRHANIQEVLSEDASLRAQTLDDEYSLKVEVPLNFSRGEFFREANISLGYNYISSKDLSENSNSSGELSVVSAVEGNATVSIRKKRAHQNLSTPLGMKLDLSAQQSVGLTRAMQYQAIGDLIIRGMGTNHNLVLSAGWKYEPLENPYQFMDLFLYPRGFSTPGFDQMVTLQSAYHFPLAYPDFGFAGIFYCSRIRASIFADYGYTSLSTGISGTSSEFLGSVGSELILDTRWLNLIEIPLGVRFSLLLSPDPSDVSRKMKWEFVVPVFRM